MHVSRIQILLVKPACKLGPGPYLQLNISPEVSKCNQLFEQAHFLYQSLGPLQLKAAVCIYLKVAQKLTLSVSLSKL